MNEPLKDVDIRRAAGDRLLHKARNCSDTLIVDELGLGHGACRVDVAVINGHFRGIEIKSDVDSLTRLPRQVVHYGEVMDRATLIVTERHLDAATELLPGWWGIISASRAKSGAVKFSRIRADRINRHTTPLMVARLLWRSEAADLLRKFGYAERDIRGPREVLYTMLTREMPKTSLAKVVRTTLKARKYWRDR